MGPRDQLITRGFTTLRKLFRDRRRAPAIALAKTDRMRGTSLEVVAGMRKRYRVLFFAVLVAALIVPVGFALSLDTTPVATQLVHSAMLPGAVAPPALPWTMPDAAKLLGVGTLLFGLAAAVKKSTS
jgi:hypothetical protein